MHKLHTFYIPVMGTGFTLDTPLRVAKYGISSVVSLVDDTLIEQARAHYCRAFDEHYTPITKNDEDYRARRITEYLNLCDRIIRKQFDELRNCAFELGSELNKYFELLPETSPVKKMYLKMLSMNNVAEKERLQEQLRAEIEPGRIDVNIMTKLNRPNLSKDGSRLPAEFADAMAALRGYAKSTLESAIVFSAGFNRQLYSYVENFKDFYADAKGYMKKKIIIKASDYRSCLTQGKFFAKKGLWVSEYRVESGLNCGGHVFPSAGQLLGPIVQEIKDKKRELIETLYGMYTTARRLKKMPVSENTPETLVTVQGGVGTSQEHNFLLSYYGADQVGWATPFLLCQEAVSVNDDMLQKLCNAKEEDLYTSDVSPVGVPFNNLHSAPSEIEKQRKIDAGCPGSLCPKGHLAFSEEFDGQLLCVASRKYQELKIKQLDNRAMTRKDYERACMETRNKSCLCHDLGGTFLLFNKIVSSSENVFPAICPGPNMAYYDRPYTLKELVDHIYGRVNLIENVSRPHMFIKELEVNINFLENEINKDMPWPQPKQLIYFLQFWRRLLGGIDYYKGLLETIACNSRDKKRELQTHLQNNRNRLNKIVSDANLLFKMNITERLQAIKEKYQSGIRKKLRP